MVFQSDFDPMITPTRGWVEDAFCFLAICHSLCGHEIGFPARKCVKWDIYDLCDQLKTHCAARPALDITVQLTVTKELFMRFAILTALLCLLAPTNIFAE